MATGKLTGDGSGLRQLQKSHNVLQVGDLIEADHNGETGTGTITAIHGKRVLVQLTICSDTPWTSTIPGGTVPAGLPAHTGCGYRAHMCACILGETFHD